MRAAPHRSSIRTFLVSLAAVAIAGFCALPAWAVQPSVKVVAITGDPAPDGNGVLDISRLSVPVLNDAGQVAFYSPLTDTDGETSDDDGLFRGDGVTPLVQLARTGVAAPDGNGVISGLSPPDNHPLNNAGQVVFTASLTETSGGSSDNRALLRADGATMIQMARKGQAAPDGDGILSSVTANPFGDPRLNDAGHVAFESTLTGTSQADEFNGIFFSDGVTLTQLARYGDAAPDGNGILFFFGDPAWNNAGQATFRAFVDNTSGGTDDDTGFFRADSAGIVQIARGGQTAPDGNGELTGVNPYFTLNDLGHVAFPAFVRNTVGETTDDEGVFLGDGTTLVQIAREGQTGPEGGTFNRFGVASRYPPVVNNSGQVAFSADLGGIDIVPGPRLFRGDGNTFVQVVAPGQEAPDGNGIMRPLSFVDTALNEAGQLAFLTAVTDTSGGSSDNGGLFFFDDSLGLLQVARKGDAFFGSTITNVRFSTCSEFGDEGSGLNKEGVPRVAYQFDLADGRKGVAVWSPVPEPTSLALVLVALIVGLALRNRTRSLSGVE